MLSSPEGRTLIEGLEETGRALVAEFQSLDDAEAGLSPEGEEWSAKQNLAHLTEIEPGLVDEALALITNPDVPIGRPPGALWGEAQNTANDRPLADLVKEFDEVNRVTLRRLSELTDEDLSRPGTHLGLGKVTVLGTLMVTLAHRRAHLFQQRSNVIVARTRQDGRVPEEAYTVTGVSGPTLVLLDAVASKWNPVVEALARDYRIVHVKSAALTATLEQLRRDLQLNEMRLAGIASSAVDACKYAFAHPERLAGLIMINLPVLPFSRDGRPDDFAAIKAPALTLVGERYPQAQLAQQRGWQFANCRVAVVTGADRDVPLEQPDAVIEAIRSFVPLSVWGRA